MDRERVVAILEEVGTLLELDGANPFRCNAYRNAARALQQYDGDLAALVAGGRVGELRGVGMQMAAHVEELARTGKLAFHESLAEKTPPGLLLMLRIPGFGPKRVRQVRTDLGIDTIDALKAAAADGRLADLKGFGVKLVAKILEGIAYLGQTANRVLAPAARAEAERLRAALAADPRVRRIEICGSLRRRASTCKDVDLLVASDDAEPIIEKFVGLPGVTRIAAQGPTKASVVLDGGLNADLRVVPPAAFPFALHYFTGSKAHNIRMRQRALDRGLGLNEYELAGANGAVACADEEALFAALGLPWIPPELREDHGEFDAAEAGALPRMISAADLTGAFHNHTTWSDGANTLAEMAAAAAALGWQYLGIADHSQTAAYAGGLSPARVRQQREEVAKVAATKPGVRLFWGIESDILADGALDYDAETLGLFDYVVASVHSQFQLSEAEQTARLVRAVSHPRCTMLGHATGRLLLRREGYPIDLEAVLKACAKHGTVVEINANPIRLDLDWTWCRRAKALGVVFAINPDAHATAGLADVKYGVESARRGWLEAADVLNARPLPEIERFLAARREKAAAAE